MLAPVDEHAVQGDEPADRENMNAAGTGSVGRRRSISNTARSVISKFSDHSRERQEPEYNDDVVDLLDVLGKSKETFTKGRLS